MTRLLIAAAALVLSGCGAWYKPGSTQADLDRDNYTCQMQAAQSYPPVYSTSPGYTSPARTNCYTSYGYTNCTTTPGVTYPGATMDMNALARVAATNSCLRANGWEFRVN